MQKVPNRESRASLGEEVWIELDDDVAPEGAETTWTDEDAARLALPTGYWRVRRN
jgi:hypothetical protein